MSTAKNHPDIYHLDCFSGLAGDMFLGACLDLGMPLDLLEDAVARLDLPDVRLEARASTRAGIGGIRFRVMQRGLPIEGPDPEEGAELVVGPGAVAAPAKEHVHSHGHRHGAREDGRFEAERGGRHQSLSEILARIGRSGLPVAVVERSEAMFRRLGEVEAGIHRIDIEEVHFHELGAVDSIVDIVGAAVAIEYLSPTRVTASTLVVGSGSVSTEHGILPVPAPATMALLEGAPIAPGPRGELLTPTGALILGHLAPDYGEGPSFRVDKQGFGLGRWELPDRANAVRLSAGYENAMSGNRDIDVTTVTVLECQIDDLTGEGFGHLMERLMDEGALDVFYTPVQMKKNRPGVLVTVLTRPDRLERLAGTLMLESGSLGCRYRHVSRYEAKRKSTTVRTEVGELRVKQAWFGGRLVSQAPEYEDCRRLALECGRPWREVYALALAALPSHPVEEPSENSH